MPYCTSCGQWNAAGAYCGTCGAAFPQATTATATVAPPSYAAPAAERPITEGIAIVALLLNILVWPGLGSLVAGEKVGWAQGFIFLFGIPLVLLLVGIPMLIGAWIWGIVTGVELIQRASRQAAARQVPAAPPPPT